MDNKNFVAPSNPFVATWGTVKRRDWFFTTWLCKDFKLDKQYGPFRLRKYFVWSELFLMSLVLQDLTLDIQAYYNMSKCFISCLDPV